jgi:hypothetical protein
MVGKRLCDRHVFRPFADRTKGVDRLVKVRPALHGAVFLISRDAAVGIARHAPIECSSRFAILTDELLAAQTAATFALALLHAISPGAMRSSSE